jgi:HEAT repeat protein
MMGIFNRKPRVKALARAGNVDGLIDASRYRQPTPSGDGGAIDLGLRIRVAAIHALRDIGPTEGQAAVVDRLSDPEDRVRTAAVVVLFERGDASAIANALRWLPRNGNSRDLALRALLELDQPDSARMVGDALLHQLADESLDEDEMVAFDELLERDSREGAVDDVLRMLADALRDGDSFVADRAVQLLVRMAPDSVDVLLGELAEGSGGHRAALALAQVKDVRALEPLISGLDHPDPRTRAASCAALGELRDSVAVEPLMRATQDPEFTVRARAGSALDQLGTVAVVVGISALLRPEIAALENGAETAAELEATTTPDDPRNGRTAARATTLERVAWLLEGLGTAGQSGVY